MDFNQNMVAQITDYVEELSAAEQKKLLQALEKKALLAEALRLNKSVRKTPISIEQICAEVVKVRGKRKRA